MWATRWPLAPKYLYHFDSVNFALAIDDFAPSKHQPQPPGYPLFVGLLKLIHPVTADAQDALVAAGLFVSAAALALLWRLGTAMFGGSAGLLAAALLLFNPVFWFGGLTNQVRLCLAAGSAGVALLAWRALQRPDNPSHLMMAFGAVGAAAGFRPALGVLLAPLLFWVWRRNGGSAAILAKGCGCLLLTSVPWMAITAMASGGIQSWLSLMWGYSSEQFGGSSLAFGAGHAAAGNMAFRALIWIGLGALTWVWALPAVWRRNPAAEGLRIPFLIVWLVPLLLFSAFIHIGDPDQALASIPVICLAGGGVLGSFAKHSPRARVGALAAGVALLNAVMFFKPPSAVAKSSSYRAVQRVDIRTQEVIDAIEELRGATPAMIVGYDDLVTWRQLSYYFPSDFVVYLPPQPSPSTGWTLFNGKATDSRFPDSNSSHRMIVLSGPDRERLLADGWQPHGPVVFRDMPSEAEVRVGPYRLGRSGIQRSL